MAEGSTRTIAIGADHAGFELKEHLRRYLRDKKGFEVIDCGTDSDQPVDYPVFAERVARHVADGKCFRGIMIDGAGIGSCIVANKVPGVRAALCHDVTSARNSREHNDANVLTLGARFIGTGLAEQIVDAWLAWECTAERHRRRVAMIEQIERGDGRASGAPPSPLPSTAAADEALSGEDLERIVARIGELCRDPNVAGGDRLACLFCQVCLQCKPEQIRELLDAGANRIGYRQGQPPVPADLARYIDHTLLRPDATVDDIRRLCAEAREFGFAAVCVNPTYVKLAVRELSGTDVVVASVAGFPLGAHLPEIKAMEARRAIREGAREIDMVINVGALKSGDTDLVLRDIMAVTDACLERRAVCKVIIEAALLTDDEKVTACRLAKRARADFVKTSTGFGPGGATVHDVALMREAVCGKLGVKAAGGIRSFEDARKMIEAGATRIGASAGVKIVQEAREMTVSQ